MMQNFVIDWNNENETIEESKQNASNKMQVYLWAMQTLMTRRKRQKINVSEKIYILFSRTKCSTQRCSFYIIYQ